MTDEGMTDEELNFVDVLRDATLVALRQKNRHAETWRRAGRSGSNDPLTAQSVAQNCETEHIINDQLTHPSL